MSNYICTECGAHLDPGEHCTCIRERENEQKIGRSIAIDVVRALDEFGMQYTISWLQVERYLNIMRDEDIACLHVYNHIYDIVHNFRYKAMDMLCEEYHISVKKVIR